MAPTSLSHQDDCDKTHNQLRAVKSGVVSQLTFPACGRDIMPSPGLTIIEMRAMP